MGVDGMQRPAKSRIPRRTLHASSTSSKRAARIHKKLIMQLETFRDGGGITCTNMALHMSDGS